MSKDKAKYAVCIVALGLLSIFLANSLWTEIAGNLPNVELPEKTAIKSFADTIISLEFVFCKEKNPKFRTQ